MKLIVFVLIGWSLVGCKKAYSPTAPIGFKPDSSKLVGTWGLTRDSKLKLFQMGFGNTNQTSLSLAKDYSLRAFHFPQEFLDKRNPIRYASNKGTWTVSDQGVWVVRVTINSYSEQLKICGSPSNMTLTKPIGDIEGDVILFHKLE